jgi:organic radical activating enzyme
MGGEPLCPENVPLTKLLIEEVKAKYPNKKIYIWTGYTMEELTPKINLDKDIHYILTNINCLIDGRYIESERDITLPLRGSRNQNVYPIKIVSKALELFLQSLPANSYYQLIGFGSNFKKYDENPKEYTKENIQKSLEIIKSLNADLGGTNISSPLKEIFTVSKFLIVPSKIFS